MIYLADTTGIWAAAISAVGGIVATYGAIQLRARIATRNLRRQPKDRMETIFDGYEKLIRQQQLDIDRKAKQLDQTQLAITHLQDELDKTKDIIQQYQEELMASREANRELVTQLDTIKHRLPRA